MEQTIQATPLKSFFARAKKYLKKLLAFGIGAAALAALTACSDFDYINTCKEAVFNDIDATRTLEQAVKENSYLGDAKWKVVSLPNDKKGVELTCNFTSYVEISFIFLVDQNLISDSQIVLVKMVVRKSKKIYGFLGDDGYIETETTDKGELVGGLKLIYRK